MLPEPLPPWPNNGIFADLSRINTPAYLDQNTAIPYVQQWNFGFGFEFLRDYGAEVMYVATKGTQLFGPARRYNTVDLKRYAELYTAGFNMNDRFPNPDGLVDATGHVITVTRTALLRPNPMLGAIISPLAQGHNSIYHSLQSQLIKRFSHGVLFNVNYTFSKSIDTSSCEGQFCGTNLGDWATVQPQLFGGDRRLERSVSAFDIKHNIRYSFNLDLPVGRGRALGGSAGPVLNKIIGNWKLSGIGSVQSGRPWAAFNGASAGFPDDVGTVRPNWKPGATGCIVNPEWRNQLNNFSRRYANYYLVEQMFEPTRRFEVGNVSRYLDQCRMPWRTILNAAALKEFLLNERIKIVFRVEAFQVLNNPNFVGNVNSNNVFQNLNYTAYAQPPIDPVQNIRTTYTDMTQNIGPTRTMQIGLKVYF